MLFFWSVIFFLKKRGGVEVGNQPWCVWPWRFAAVPVITKTNSKNQQKNNNDKLMNNDIEHVDISKGHWTEISVLKAGQDFKIQNKNNKICAFVYVCGKDSRDVRGPLVIAQGTSAQAQ
jgi:hypothetical protein